MHSIGFVYNALGGTTQVVMWDEDSQTLLLKDSDDVSVSSFLKDVCGNPAPEDVYTEQLKNVPVRTESDEDVC